MCKSDNTNLSAEQNLLIHKYLDKQMRLYLPIISIACALFGGLVTWAVKEGAEIKAVMAYEENLLQRMSSVETALERTREKAVEASSAAKVAAALAVDRAESANIAATSAEQLAINAKNKAATLDLQLGKATSSQDAAKAIDEVFITRLQNVENTVDDLYNRVAFKSDFDLLEERLDRGEFDRLQIGGVQIKPYPSNNKHLRITAETVTLKHPGGTRLQMMDPTMRNPFIRIWTEDTGGGNTRGRIEVWDNNNRSAVLDPKD